MIEKVFLEYEQIYRDILNKFYPSLNSTGFQERNLTVNFSKCFDNVYGRENVVSWFELQFGEKNNNHFDCVIIADKKIFFVESKRFSSAKLKKDSANEDILRIEDFVKNGFCDDVRFANFRKYEIYGVILADVWKETKAKIRIYDEYKIKTFFNNASSFFEYNIIDFDDIEDVKKYSLLSYIWKIK